MGKTTNLGLHTTASDETSKTFLEYRTELSGTGADSNMNIIDKAYGEMDAKIDANKQTETEKFSTLDSTVSGIQSGLSQEVTARTSGDQLLNARIDELVAPSGEAPSAAEVQDARVGVDATTYASLGEAIRGQVGDLKNDSDAFVVWRPHAWQQGLYGAREGRYDSSYTNAICLYDPLPTVINRVFCSDTYRFRLHAWQGTAIAANYKGIWDGNTFVKADPSTAYFTSLTLSGLFKDYPDYQYKLTFFNADKTTNVGIEDSSNLTVVYYKTALIANDIGNLERSITSNELYWLQWDNWIYYVGQGFYGINRTRIGLQNMQTANTDITISVDEGYKVSCVVFSQPSAELQYEDHRSGWVTSYRVKAGEFFLLNMAKSDDSEIAVSESVHLHISESGALYAYHVDGKKIDLSVQGFDAIKQPYDLPLPRAIHEGLTSRQDFDIYDGVIFQLYSDNYVALLNLDTGSVIASYPLNSGHSNSCQFSKEFYNANDRFPLLYCFGYDDNYCYVNRVTDSGAELIRTYYLQTDGYRFSGGVDSKNNRLITIHFAENSSSDGSNNHNIITVWDLNKVTDDGNGHLIPSIVKQTNIPFFPIVQGCTWFKDALYVTSGDYNPYKVEVKITAFDTDGNVVTEITDFPSEIKQGEAEGITFYKSQNKYECYFATYYLYKLVF